MHSLITLLQINWLIISLVVGNILWALQSYCHPPRIAKGPTIRKVMGVGGGEFSSHRNFFSLSNSLYEYFLGHSMNTF